MGSFGPVELPAISLEDLDDLGGGHPSSIQYLGCIARRGAQRAGLFTRAPWSSATAWARRGLPGEGVVQRLGLALRREDGAWECAARPSFRAPAPIDKHRSPRLHA